MRLVLASGSPRRAELLAAAGFDFDVLRVDIDERLHANEVPGDYVQRLSRQKCAHAVRLLAQPPAPPGQPTGEAIIIAADTTVVVDDAILGKPANEDEARAMLRRLSGRSHQVMTGVTVSSSSRELTRLETTTVWFASLTNAEVSWYVSTGEAHDKAGAYAIQGRASRFIPRIEGSYSNVVGLPIALVSELLTHLGMVATG